MMDDERVAVIDMAERRLAFQLRALHDDDYVYYANGTSPYRE